MSDGFVDVAIIGGGLAGTAAALELAKRGLRVAFFEQYEMGHAHGSSHGRARIFRYAYDASEYVTLAREAESGWRRLEDDSGQILLEKSGGVDVGPPARLDSIEQALKNAAAPFERLGREAAGRRFGWLTVPEGWEVLYQPDAGVLSADKCLLAMCGLAHAAGVILHERTRVAAISEQDSSVEIESTSETTHAQLVVVAAGGWANELLEPLGMAVPLRVTREHVAHFKSTSDALPRPFIWHPTGSFEYYGLPNGSEPVMKVGQHLAGPEAVAGTPAEPEQERTDDISRFVSENLPGFDPVPIRPETCLYSSTPDDDFIIDRVGRVVFGVGLGGHGFKFGPRIGELLADLAQGKDIEFAQRFSAARFGEDRPYAG